MEPLLARHVSETLARLREAEFVELLAVDYLALITDPIREARRVAEFLGPEILPAPEVMAAAVRPELHRVREGRL